MVSWSGEDLESVPLPDDPEDFDALHRRAWLYRRINEEGHFSLLEPEEIAEKFGVAMRTIYYDRDCVAEYVEEEKVGITHTGRNYSIFEKAKREALREGDWQGAIEALQAEAEWLEDRGAISTEPDQVEVDVEWREFVEEQE